VSEEDGALRVEHGLTQDELAQCVGAARETVNKALANFAAQEWIGLRSRVITVLDPAPLRALLG
jgi:CRP/FNR family transcriptional regulator, cyclic AMP receptor protein